MLSTSLKAKYEPSLEHWAKRSTSEPSCNADKRMYLSNDLLVLLMHVRLEEIAICNTKPFLHTTQADTPTCQEL